MIAPHAVKSHHRPPGKDVSFGDLDSATSISGRHAVLEARRNGRTRSTSRCRRLSTRSRLASATPSSCWARKERSPSRLWRRRPLPHRRDSVVGNARAGLCAGARHIRRPAEPRSAANQFVDTVGEPMALIALDAAPGLARGPRRSAAGSRVVLRHYDAFSPTVATRTGATSISPPKRLAVRAVAQRLAAAQSWLDATERLRPTPRSTLSGVGEIGRRLRWRTDGRGFRPALRRPHALAQADAIGRTALPIAWKAVAGVFAGGSPACWSSDAGPASSLRRSMSKAAVEQPVFVKPLAAPARRRQAIANGAVARREALASSRARCAPGRLRAEASEERAPARRSRSRSTRRGASAPRALSLSPRATLRRRGLS